MSRTPLLPLPDGLEIISVSESPDELLVRVISERPSSCCPLCGTPSHAIHSYYRRKPMGLPCVGRPIRFLLTVKKFFCREVICPRKIFTEQFPDFLEPSSRLTTRLRKAVQEISFATSGRGGEDLCPKLGIRVSDVTWLWSLQLVPTPVAGKVRVVGIDDWRGLRGQRYGTIVVDLVCFKIVDLLAERSAESVQKWLEAHPEVEIVSRDRGGTYVDGATQGAPLAIQVCDRWHILKNLGEAIEAFLIRSHIRLASDGDESANAGAPFNDILRYSSTARENTGSTLAQMEAVPADKRAA